VTRPQPSVDGVVRTAIAQLDHVRLQAGRLAAEVEAAVGGSATDVDRQLAEALSAVERSTRRALGVLAQLMRAS
jgi:hypothetical protein